MSTNEPSSSQKSTGSQDDDTEKTEIFSLKEVIENEDEEAATAVLGASDDCNCSYDSGYVFRQALYGCKTCMNESTNSNGEPILHGICLACSYECHANHELYELYTKRNFKCDCGNSRFTNGNQCKLRPNKDPLNDQNVYNHNFVGLYCVCDQAYPAPAPPIPPPPPSTPTALSQPDPEPVEDPNDDMVQCVICEDWFHVGHLKGIELYRQADQSIEDFEDMVCHMCMAKSTDFLWFYQGSNPLEAVDVNIDGNPSPNTSRAPDECLLEALKQKHEASIRSKFIQPRPDGCACLLKSKWRRCLCRCPACLLMYKDRKCEYLLSDNDSIAYYEERGKTRVADAENKVISDELGKMNRVSQIEFMYSLNDFKEELAQFLAQFARDGKVVKRENVVEFFDTLNDKRKRRKLDATGGNYFCK